MAKLFDEDGNEVEGALTKEEIETATAAAVETAKTEALDAYKKEHPEETPEEKTAREAAEAAATAAEKTPQQIAEEAVASALRTRDIADMAKAFAPGDAAKQAEIIANAGRLTGYEQTPEGLAGQVENAAKMAGIDVSGIDVSSVGNTGGGRNIDNANQVKTTEVDKTVQKILSISPEDVKKYGPKVEEILGVAPTVNE